jgi:hypothetical protein
MCGPLQPQAMESLAEFEPSTRCLEDSHGIQPSYRDTRNAARFCDKTYAKTSRRPITSGTSGYRYGSRITNGRLLADRATEDSASDILGI